MDDQVEFDINESLKLYLSDVTTITTPEANPELIDGENDPDSLTPGLVDSVLDSVIDLITENPEGLFRSSTFDTLQFLLKHSSVLSTQSLSKILNLIVSGLSTSADVANHDIENDEQETLPQHKRLLEMYAFLLQWSISAVETKAQEKSSTGPARRGGKGAKSKSTAKDNAWDSSSQIQNAMDVMCRVMKLKLNRIFQTTSDRDTFINLFTRSIYLIMESEARVKITAVRMFCFKVLCVAVKHHGHALGAQTSIVQNLTYFEHLSEPMAEFLHILSEQYDYPQLSAEILRELAAKEFSQSDTKGPKSVSAFIIKLSELQPRLVIKEMGLLAKFLDSEAHTLRCAVIEVCGNLLVDLSKQDEKTETTKIQINAFFDTLEQRFLDTAPFCRVRAMQVLAKICDLEQKFPKRRQNAAELAMQSLQDKSSNVRRNAIKLLRKLVSSHPFSLMHGGQLSHKEWIERLEAVESQLDALKPPPDSPGLARTAAGEERVDQELLDDATQAEEEPKELTEEEKIAAVKKAQEEAATSELIGKLQLTRKYYLEALKFIEIIHEASEIAVQLLSSPNKTEVIDVMDFFVTIDAFKIETARKGIRRMLRLIWTKGNSDEGKGVQNHLIDNYKSLFFDAPEMFSTNDAANFVARNMISLTFGATPAELTSLEQLLSTMFKAGHIPELVITKLWQVYGVNKEISRAQRRGAIIVLGMIALASPEVVVKEIDTMLRVGLGQLGRNDLVLAKFTSVALRRMIPTAKKVQEKTASAGLSKMSNNHEVLRMLASILLTTSASKDWYGMAEQAISAIYVLSDHPDVLCSEVLRQKTRLVFQQTKDLSSLSRTSSPEPDAMDIDGEELVTNPETEPHELEPTETKQEKPSIALSQLLFTVGHIAIKQIVHLELCELDFKRRKQDQEKNKPVANPSPDKSSGPPSAQRKKTAAEEVLVEKQKEEEKDELDLIGGTTEDDFTEAIAHIRERELLYGPHSLLANFGPLVTEICANNTAYKDRNLQAQATLCLAKLMCVSSEYCEKNLPLLITILERSTDPIVRSNAVIALGDMAVCFNHLIDENTDFLYRRLNDADESVKRTCLMTLTFLILAGQVKVKGQLGEMAKCLEDGDKKIADLARMFFTELATKDNAVYNQFVDMFSVLTQEGPLEGGVMEEEAVKRILKFLCGFIEKDKHAKNLAEKLAARLNRCANKRQWDDTAYALSLLQHKNEDIVRRIQEGYRVVETEA
ncbi:condensin complex subunit 1 [Cladophialophora psammophila CBS 110553]|uniref:Condensin complex subunit 1 n=1 Tax=Cladophialophora psammophila CBS 110553 TaxID=1182543 RepID=W9WZB9_9EURO|nr:condensin complex subunit 1 [Cladophialophora psammophila CBS 110553]EXJ73298.1 condensin complex subunit 1 [Cladophialophora psammophila CBS 110553]